jgi:hypothetical protein
MAAIIRKSESEEAVLHQEGGVVDDIISKSEEHLEPDSFEVGYA